MMPLFSNIKIVNNMSKIVVLIKIVWMHTNYLLTAPQIQINHNAASLKMN